MFSDGPKRSLQSSSCSEGAESFVDSQFNSGLNILSQYGMAIGAMIILFLIAYLILRKYDKLQKDVGFIQHFLTFVWHPKSQIGKVFAIISISQMHAGGSFGDSETPTRMLYFAIGAIVFELAVRLMIGICLIVTKNHLVYCFIFFFIDSADFEMMNIGKEDANTEHEFISFFMDTISNIPGLLFNCIAFIYSPNYMAVLSYFMTLIDMTITAITYFRYVKKLETIKTIFYGVYFIIENYAFSAMFSLSVFATGADWVYPILINFGLGLLFAILAVCKLCGTQGSCLKEYLMSWRFFYIPFGGVSYGLENYLCKQALGIFLVVWIESHTELRYFGGGANPCYQFSLFFAIAMIGFAVWTILNVFIIIIYFCKSDKNSDIDNLVKFEIVLLQSNDCQTGHTPVSSTELGQL